MIIESKYKHTFYLIISLLLVRLITFFCFEISMDEKWLFELWQHINQEYLQNNFFESLLNFHAQPPFWNFIIGLGLKISNSISINSYMSLINLLCTVIILYSSHHLLRILNFNRDQIYFILLFLIILSPSILFFENFSSYAHFTCTLLFLIKLNFLKIFKKFKFRYEFQIYTYSSLLILTWSAYIIYFNLLIFFLLTPLFIKKKRILKSSIIFLIFFLLGMSPSIKNKILFNTFANSSWTGLNAAQATGYDKQNWPLCSFNRDNLDQYNDMYKKSLKNKNYLNKQILNDYSYNNLGYIYKSINCDNLSKKFLISNFYKITKIKVQRFISVHAHLSIDFAFKPKNWKENFLVLEKLNYNNFFKSSVFLFFLLNYLFYIGVIIFYLNKKNKDYLGYFLIVNLVLYSYLIFVSFYGSAWEQERMRYTGYSFIFICFSLMIKQIIFLKQKLKNNFIV